MLLRLPCFNKPNIQSYSCPEVTAASRDGCQHRGDCTQPSRTVLALGKCQMCNCNSELSQPRQHGPGKARGRSEHGQGCQGTHQRHTPSAPLPAQGQGTRQEGTLSSCCGTLPALPAAPELCPPPHRIDMLMDFSNFLDEVSIKRANIYRATSQDTSILNHDLPEQQE